MAEDTTKPQGKFIHYLKYLSAFTFLLTIFMAGFVIAHSRQSSEVSKLKNDVDRKEKDFENATNQLNIVTSSFEKYRRQYPGLTDEELNKENNKLKIELQIGTNKIKELSDQLSAKNDEIKNAKIDLQNATAKIKNHDENSDKIKKLTEELNKKDNELEINKNIIKETNSKFTQIESKKEQLEKNLKEADAKIKELQSQKEGLDRKLKAIPMQPPLAFGNIRQEPRYTNSANIQQSKLINYKTKIEQLQIEINKTRYAFGKAISITVTEIKQGKIYGFIAAEGFPTLKIEGYEIGKKIFYNAVEFYEIKIQRTLGEHWAYFVITQYKKL